MSASRIPRPGAGNSVDPRSPSTAMRSTPTSPAPPSGFKPNNPFANRSLHPPTQSPNPPGRIHQLQPPPQAQPKRRPRPLAPEESLITSPISQPRRPVPNLLSSPDPALPRPRGGVRVGNGFPPSHLVSHVHAYGNLQQLHYVNPLGESMIRLRPQLMVHRNNELELLRSQRMVDRTHFLSNIHPCHCFSNRLSLMLGNLRGLLI